MRPRVKTILAAVLLVAIVIASRRLAPALSVMLEVIARLGVLAPIAFIAIYILACVAFVPGSILTIGGGVLFGVIRGVIYVSIAATLGAAAAFLIGRYLARDWIAAKLAANPSFQAIDRAVAREGWKIVGLVRLSPVFPFNLLNYAFGLTRVSLRDYFFASWVGMLPGTAAYVYVGSVARDLTGADRTAVGTPARWALNLLGLAATIAVAVYVARIGARALNEKNSAREVGDVR